ncbi:MAG: MBL fold metallo-hydrolase, partial [Sulfurovaceae bacterium]|nr:MBL fold metallo-hydrolase [Sulfurovaceae bacterium]
MGIRFEFLEAGNGDCIFISTTEGTNILIDGGIENTYPRKLKPLLKREVRDKGIKLDLVVLTHYDDDHIAGLLKLLEEETKQIKNGKSTIIKEFWFNSFDEALVKPINYSNNTSAKQQIKFDDY